MVNTLSTAMQEAALRYSQGYPVNFDEEARKVMTEPIGAIVKRIKPDGEEKIGAELYEQFKGLPVGTLLALHRSEEQVEKDMKDAERYRFLSDRLFGVDFDYCESGKTVLLLDWPASPVSAGMDETVDAAIDSTKGESK